MSIKAIDAIISKKLRDVILFSKEAYEIFKAVGFFGTFFIDFLTKWILPMVYEISVD